MTKAVNPKYGVDGVINKSTLLEDEKFRNMYFDNVLKLIPRGYHQEFESIKIDYFAWKEQTKLKASRKEQRRGLEQLQRQLQRVIKSIKQLSPKTHAKLERVLRVVYWSHTPLGHSANGCEQMGDLRVWASAMNRSFLKLQKQSPSKKQYQKHVKLTGDLECMLRSMNPETEGNLVITLCRYPIHYSFNEDAEEGAIAIDAFFYRAYLMDKAVKHTIVECKRPGKNVELDKRLTLYRFIKLYEKITLTKVTLGSSGGDNLQKGGDVLSSAGQLALTFFADARDRISKTPSTLCNMIARYIHCRNKYGEALS